MWKQNVIWTTSLEKRQKHGLVSHTQLYSNLKSSKNWMTLGHITSKAIVQTCWIRGTRTWEVWGLLPWTSESRIYSQERRTFYLACRPMLQAGNCKRKIPFAENWRDMWQNLCQQQNGETFAKCPKAPKMCHLEPSSGCKKRRSWNT